MMKRSIVTLFKRSFSIQGIVKQQKFVPKHSAVDSHDIKVLSEFINSKQKLFVLTGAGISTESGIRDYRSEGVGLYATSSSRPRSARRENTHASPGRDCWGILTCMTWRTYETSRR